MIACAKSCVVDLALLNLANMKTAAAPPTKTPVSGTAFPFYQIYVTTHHKTTTSKNEEKSAGKPFEHERRQLSFTEIAKDDNSRFYNMSEKTVYNSKTICLRT